MVASNYLGSGKRYDGANGVDVAVSRGPAGEFMYSYEPMRDHAATVQREQPRATVRFVCPLNCVTVAGFTSPDPDGSVIEVELGQGGFLTMATRIWR